MWKMEADLIRAVAPALLGAPRQRPHGWASNARLHPSNHRWARQPSTPPPSPPLPRLIHPPSGPTASHCATPSGWMQHPATMATSRRSETLKEKLMVKGGNKRSGKKKPLKFDIRNSLGFSFSTNHSTTQSRVFFFVLSSPVVFTNWILF